MIVYRDQAYTADEWEARNRRLSARRNAQGHSPDEKARRAAYAREWRARNPERWREIRRRYKRNALRRVVGSLHSLSCIGPTRATGCVCDKIKMYNRPERLRVA